jgi:glycosyltransferase involved in cell wall biosynthesis
MDKYRSLTVILPVFNEEDSIRGTIGHSVDYLKKQVFFADYEIIAVNDGSSDQTGFILDELKKTFACLKVITHENNLGYGRALVSGVQEARFPLVLMMDGDGQFQIDALEGMRDYIPEYDIVTGYREKRTDPLPRIFIGKAYTWLACLLFGLRVKDVNCGFKLFKKEILDFDGAISHAGAFYTGIYIRAKARNGRIKEVPVAHFPRMGGKPTGASVKVVFTAVSDLVRLSYLGKHR